MRIDFKSLVGKDLLVLAGMERGLAAREDFNLDSLDEADEDVVIIAPDSLEAIAPSFVQGFLSRSYSKLGEDRLREKYNFQLSDDLHSDILEGIKRLRMKRTIAGHKLAR